MGVGIRLSFMMRVAKDKDKRSFVVHKEIAPAVDCRGDVNSYNAPSIPKKAVCCSALRSINFKLFFCDHMQ